MFRRTTHHAQALVEFAIASTLILLLLAAAVDLGLVFLNLQGITNASQEGALYGSRYLVNVNGKSELDYDGIRQRVRRESGATGGIGFVNMQDLNSDDIPDAIANDSNGDGADAVDDNGDGKFDRFQFGFVGADGKITAVSGYFALGSGPAGARPLIDYDISQQFPDRFQYGIDDTGDGRFDRVTGLIAAGTEPAGYTKVIDNYIKVEGLLDVDKNGDLSNDNNANCPNFADPNLQCYVRVVVLSDHQTVFPLLDPVWDDKVPLTSRFVMPLRSGTSRVGEPTNTTFVITNTPVTPTATPTLTNTPLPPTATPTSTGTREPEVQPTPPPPTATNTRRPSATPCVGCTPTNTRTPRPATNTPRPGTNTPRPATRTPRPVTNTPPAVTNTARPATPTPRPTRSGS